MNSRAWGPLPKRNICFGDFESELQAEPLPGQEWRGPVRTGCGDPAGKQSGVQRAQTLFPRNHAFRRQSSHTSSPQAFPGDLIF